MKNPQNVAGRNLAMQALHITESTRPKSWIDGLHFGSQSYLAEEKAKRVNAIKRVIATGKPDATLIQRWSDKCGA